jgi:hypothetical protein
MPCGVDPLFPVDPKLWVVTFKPEEQLILVLMHDLMD